MQSAHTGYGHLRWQQRASLVAMQCYKAFLPNSQSPQPIIMSRRDQCTHALTHTTNATHATHTTHATYATNTCPAHPCTHPHMPRPPLHTSTHALPTPAHIHTCPALPACPHIPHSAYPALHTCPAHPAHPACIEVVCRSCAACQQATIAISMTLTSPWCAASTTTPSSIMTLDGFGQWSGRHDAE